MPCLLMYSANNCTHRDKYIILAYRNISSVMPKKEIALDGRDLTKIIQEKKKRMHSNCQPNGAIPKIEGVLLPITLLK